MRAVQAGDVGRLTAIPGIGKKTAERIVLELKDKLPKGIVDEAAAGAGGRPRRAASCASDLLSALLNLGYHRPLAEKAVEAALAQGRVAGLRDRAEAGAARDWRAGDGQA